MVLIVIFVAMLEFSRKIFAIFLATVMLFSTLSFTVQKHICMGEITDVSYFKEADNCGMLVKKCLNNDLTNSNIYQENCCDNIQELIPGNDNEQQIVKSLEINKAKFVVAFILSFDGLQQSSERITYFKDSSPPFVVSHIYKLDETYLI